MNQRQRRRRLVRRAALILVVVWLGLVAWKGYTKGMDTWFPGYLSWVMHGRDAETPKPGPIHVMFLIVDHFEPGGNAATMNRWLVEYPKLASGHRDHDGGPPRFTWAYPIEQFRQEEIEALALLCEQGLGEIGIQLHHGHDTAETLRKKLTEGKQAIAGAAGLGDGASFRYAFVHGNWGLDNSRGDEFCGVDSELTVLQETGCFGDFTLPTLQRPCQAHVVNRIFYAKDDPNKPKSYDRGVAARADRPSPGGLLIFQGPLFINLRDWRHIFYPAIDHGDLHGSNPPTPKRVDGWVAAGIHVAGRPNWVFVKTYTHGAQPGSLSLFFEGAAEAMFSYLEREYNDGRRYALHYVTAREAYNVVKAAEAGKKGDPGAYRDFEIPPYAWGTGADRATEAGAKGGRVPRKSVE